MPQPQQRIVYRELPREPVNGAAVAGLVLGLIGIIPGALIPIPQVGFVALFFAFPAAVLAVAYAVVGLGRSKLKSFAGRGRRAAIAGIVLGGLTVLTMIVSVITWLVIGARAALGG